MKRHALILAASLAVVPALPMVRALAQAQPPSQTPPATQAPPGGEPGAPGQGRGRGRGPQTPPPPPLTCTSPALPTDNKVPAALAKEGFTAIFNGKAPDNAPARECPPGDPGAMAE